MNIFCFSDYHNEKQFLPHIRKQAMKANIIISAGDHTIFEFDQDEILKEFNSQNKTVIKAIKELKPIYAISGHIHEAEGAKDKIEKTICYNLGPMGKIIKL